MPGDFIPIAERSGLIVPLGRWMLAEVGRQQGADWPIRYVNTSAHQLREPGFADAVAELAADHDRLVIEVTEDALTEETVVSALRAVREHGVRVALDDFGAGPASLPALANGMGFHFAVPQPAGAVPLFLGAGESFLSALA